MPSLRCFSQRAREEENFKNFSVQSFRVLNPKRLRGFCLLLEKEKKKKERSNFIRFYSSVFEISHV